MGISENYSFEMLLCLFYLVLGPTYWQYGGWDNTGCIVTYYRLDGLEIESQWRQAFLCLYRPAVSPIQPPYSGSWVVPGGKRVGYGADPLLLVPRL
jgi:hypothetical protein